MGEDRTGLEIDAEVDLTGPGFAEIGEVRVGETVDWLEGKAESFWRDRSESRIFQPSRKRRKVSTTRRGVSSEGNRATR